MDIDPSIQQSLRPARPRRSRPSVLKCLGVGCIIVSSIIACTIGWFFCTAMWDVIQGTRFPHKSVYHDQAGSIKSKLQINSTMSATMPLGASPGSGGATLNRSTYVSPLIDKDTKFDLALTIFVRLPDQHGSPGGLRIGEEDDEGLQEEKAARERFGTFLQSVKRVINMPEIELLRSPREQVIYEGLVMQDLDISKGRGMGEVDLELEIPLERFYDRLIYQTDVRGSLMLIPRVSPSPLSPSSPSSSMMPLAFERVQTHSDWRPDGAEPLPRISDNLAKSLLSHFTSEQRSLLEHMAVSFSLLELHPAPSSPSPSASASASSSPISPSSASVEEEMWENQEMYAVSANEIGGGPVPDREASSEHGQKGGNGSSHEINAGDNDPELDGLTGAGKEGMEKRLKWWKEYTPYFVGRSHVYIVDETNKFNRTTFDKRHKTIKEGACGLSMALPGTRFLCVRNYALNGQWETRIELALDPQHDSTTESLEHGGVVDTLHTSQKSEVAYGPYMGVLKHMAGAKDRIALPVQRGQKMNTSAPTTFKVKHHLTFSALTPGRLHLMDEFIPPTEFNSSHTDAHWVEAHDTWEHLVGNRSKGTHPWRRFFLAMISDGILAVLVAILTPLYWYTRQTTAGIHLPASLLFGTLIVSEEITFLIQGARSQIPWGQYVAMGLFSSLDWFVGAVIIWAVWPFEMVGWTSLRRVRWAKRERATRRSEGQVGWGVWALIFAALVAFAHLTSTYNLYIIKPLHTPPLTPPDQAIYKPRWISTAFWSIHTLCLIMQYDLNARTQSYAGGYALTAYLYATKKVIDLLWLSETLVGRIGIRSGLNWIGGVQVILAGVGVWQAWNWKRVEQGVQAGEEDEE